jgi:hypothetical protein
MLKVPSHSLRILGIIMLLSICRHLISNEYGPFDRVVEFLVLALIAYEVIVFPVYHKWTVGKKSKVILVFLADDQRLHDTPPGSQASEEEAKAWVDEVKNWILAVQSFLAKDAKSAVVVFNRHSIGVRYGLKISLFAENWFYELDARLKTLQSIMEKPDVYF